MSTLSLDLLILHLHIFHASYSKTKTGCSPYLARSHYPLFPLAPSEYRSVPQIGTPLLQPYSFSTKHRGAYTRDATFSLAITLPPPLEKYRAVLWMLTETLNLTVYEFQRRRGVGADREARGGKTPDASGRLVSFSVEGRGSRALPRSSWLVHRCCMQEVCVRGRQDSQVV